MKALQRPKAQQNSLKKSSLKMPPFSESTAAATVIPITSFFVYFIFKRHEPESVLALSLLLAATPGVAVAILQPISATSALTSFIAYWSFILLFTVVYRISPFHPLAKYPGPLLCRITKLWLGVVIVKGGKTHIYVRNLHQKYNSDIIRIGPNEISIINSDALEVVLGAKGLPRGPYYETRMHEAGMSLDGLRDQALHAIRRRPWSRALNSANMKPYEEIARNVVGEFVTTLSQYTGDAVDLSEWSTFFGFDYMGQLAFTYDYGMIRSGRDTHGLMQPMKHTAIEGAWISHIPWVIPIFQRIPTTARTLNYVKSITEQIVRSRIAAGSKRKDLFYHLMDEEGHESTRPSVEICALDGALAIYAGSDTTATAISHFWYFMLTHPTYFERLRNEIDEAFPRGTDTNADFTKQAALPYLNACINEVLRIYPPVLAGIQRRVERDTGGCMTGPYFIPEDTQISLWTYAIHRDPRYFSPLPDAFWPDRWLWQNTYTLPSGDTIPQHEIVTNRGVFMPFSKGPMVCVGKNVALMEIRAVVCAVVQRFDIEIASKEDFASYEDKLAEVFLTLRGSLPVYLQARAIES